MMTWLHINIMAFFVGLPFLVAIVFLIFKFQKKIPPFLPYSNIKHFSQKTGGKTRILYLTPTFFVLTTLLFFLAFLNPTIMSKRKEAKPITNEGRALYFILDKSSSMTVGNKLDQLRRVTKEFIQERPDDLIGLVSFARMAHVLSPLTLNHDQLLEQLNTLDVAQTREEDGTAIGYAIYKTASVLSATRHFGEEEKQKGRPSYNIQGSAIILVTDGFQFPHPLDRGKRLRTIGIEEAAQYANDQEIRLYIINIDPLILDPEFEPQRNLMTRSAEATGGKFFAAPDSQSLNQIFASIDELEVSTLPVAVAAKGAQIRLFSFSPWLIFLGLVTMTLAICSETLFLRRVP